ncbi:MAG: hypothetical protein KME23_02290 [Goleter apudmare HA4340-LM2]|jgi:hypothetical protein|nr:hypothetical protein [Goleter apudmare HA4340-LM2]
MIRELERESQERLQKAYEALRLTDPEGYTGTAEREYQKELARNLQKEGSKAANASTDQRIAGKLKVAGYSLDEIQKVIEQYSPMAVKPSQDQSQAYAKTVIQRAYFPGGTDLAKQSGERRLEQLGIDTKVSIKQSLLQRTKDEEFKFIFSAPDYSLCEYHGRIIHLPKDVAVEDDDSPISIFVVSQATYQDTQESLQPSDAANLELYLTDQALKDGIDIILE